jgi:hypothetical protein
MESTRADQIEGALTNFRPSIYTKTPMLYCLGSGFRGLTIVLLFTAISPLRFRSSSPQDRGSLQQIPGTTLRVALPANWQLNGLAPTGSPQLKYTGKPEYALMVANQFPYDGAFLYGLDWSHAGATRARRDRLATASIKDN